MKKLLSFVLVAAMVLIVRPASADLSTVSALYNYIQEKHDITLPHSEGGIIDMRYLMRAIDAANETLNNGVKTSAYADDPAYATSNIAATTAMKNAVDTLIKKWDLKFWVVPVTTGKTFTLNIASAGTFYIAWGDGTVQEITKDVGPTAYSHTYADGNASNHKIYFGGDVTAHATTLNGAIYFGYNNYDVREVGGCMGCVFHTIGDGTEEWQQPKFHSTFIDNTQLTSVPSGFFDGLHGGGHRMFYQTFKNSGLTEIPEKLFGDSQLTTANNMFHETFMNCNALKEIPADLFANLTGDLKTSLFLSTFLSCTSLTAIPKGLFDGINTDSEYVNGAFTITFNTCPNLTGESAKIGDKYLYEIWPYTLPKSLTYDNSPGLADFECIPADWGGAGTKAPGTCVVAE